MLDDLYQQVILDHNRSPRCCYAMSEPSDQERGYNPLCGDEVTVFASLKDGNIEEISFTGQGCAISMAAASLLTQAVKNLPIQKAEALLLNFQSHLTGEEGKALGLLSPLAGVKAYPMRIKCASLASHALLAILRRHHE